MSSLNHRYNVEAAQSTANFDGEAREMPKRVISTNGLKVGERLARFRTDAGYSQRDLSAELGISQRMIAYYEKRDDPPPAYVLPALTKALGITIEQLLGLNGTKETPKPKRDRLWRRFKQVETLPVSDRRQIVQFIDMAIDRARLKGRRES